MPPWLEARVIVEPVRAPATARDSLPVSVTCRVPVVELLPCSVTVPPAALSLIVTAPLALAVSALAFVLETRTGPLPPLRLSAPPAPVRLSKPAEELTPVLPLSVMDVLAVRPSVRLILLFVELRLMFGATMLLRPASVMPLKELMDTEPVPAVVAVVANPRLTDPAVELSDMVLRAVSVVDSVKSLLLDTDKLPKVPPVEERLKAPAVVFTTVALPLVFTVRLGVAVLTLPMVPEVEPSDIDVEPDRVPVVADIAPLPLVVNISTVELTLFAPKLKAPLLAVVLRVTAPDEFSPVAAVMELLFETNRLLKVEPPCERVMADPLLVTVALPLVFNVKPDVTVLILPMLPAVELNDMDVVPVSTPVVLEIAPEPLVLTVTTVPLALLAPKAMKPLPAVVLSDRAPAEFIKLAPVRVKLLLSETDKLLNVDTPEARVAAPVFTTVALPVVFNVKAEVAVLMLPMAPEVELKETDVPVTIPVVEDIAPEPFELTVTTVPLTLFAPKAMKPLLAVVVSDRGPEEIALETVRLLLLDTVKLVNGPAPAERARTPVLVTVAVPVVFRVRTGVVVLIAPILPEVEDNEIDVVPVMLPVVLDIAPEPLVLTVTTVPLALLAANAMAPLLAVVVRLKAPAELSAELIVKLLLSDTVKLPNRAPSDDKLATPVLMTEAVPVVFKVRMDVVVFKLTIFPAVELNDIEFRPVIVPVVCDIAPKPLVLIFTIVPLALFAPKEMKPLLLVVVRVSPAPEFRDVATVTELLSDTDKAARVEAP